MRAVIPYDRGTLVSAVHVRGQLLSTEHTEQGTLVHALVDAQLADALEPFRVVIGKIAATAGAPEAVPDADAGPAAS